MTTRKKFTYKFKPTHLLIFAIALFFATLILLKKNGGLLNSNLLKNEKQQKTTVGINGRVTISGIEVNNFFLTAPEHISDSFVSIVRNKKYHIFYIPEMELFVISIGSRPFDELQKTAEEDFLYSLGISEDDACKLNVDITTPSYANPDKAGEVYKLGFCE